MEIKKSSPVGSEVAEGGHAIVVGISINNSYFKTENLEKLIVWASTHAKSVYLMIPDEPAVYTLIALGKKQEEARRIARRKSNALENKCRSIVNRLDLHSVKIIRWADIDPAEQYKNNLHAIYRAYCTDAAFGEIILATTLAVLRNGGIEKPELSAGVTGIQFLLQELAFITQANHILGEEKVAYVYHHTMDVLKNIIEGQYSFKADLGVGFITVE